MLKDEFEVLYEKPGEKLRKNLEYFVQEIFDPPTLVIEINNVSWDRGNCARKSGPSPLYQYDVKTQNKMNQSQQAIRGIRLRMSFNSIPKLSLIHI